MLLNLKIQNYGLIENLEIDFNQGLTIITGETGAGKSIILGALALLQGVRFETEVIKNKEKQCLVEGIFNIATYNLNAFFTENDIEYADELIIRREVSASGKSRAFINDSPVNLNVIKDLSEKLIDIHSQHENLLLKNNEFHLNIIDIYSQNQELLKKYKTIYSEYNSEISQLKLLKSKLEKQKNELELYNFQLLQIKQLNLNNNEVKELEDELNILTNSEEIKLQLSNTINILENSDYAILIQLKDAMSSLNQISKYYSESEDYINRLKSIEIELKDLKFDIDKNLNKIDYNKERLEFIKERLDAIYSVFKKYNFINENELFEFQIDLESKIAQIEVNSDSIIELEKKIKALYLQLSDISEQLHKVRLKNKLPLENSIIDLCKKLGMPKAQVILQIEKLNEINENGIDGIKFLFSANENIQPAQIEKIASGGEISRLMLILKSLIASKNSISTIIFDEIDVGVSGEIAYKMGEIFKEMSLSTQLISITHLPQIAAKADFHYMVFKTNSETHIKVLNKEERVHEIAKLLSGKEITELAILNAKELIES